MINQEIKNKDLSKNKFVFDNYFTQLAENEYVTNNSPICVWGLGKLLDRMYIDIQENYRGALLRLISSELDIKARGCRTFYHWINNECPIPVSKFFKFVSLWKEVCKKSRKEVDKTIHRAFVTSDYFSTRRGKKIKLPKFLTFELAYLLGHIAGDGHLLDQLKQKRRTGDFEFRLEIASGDEYILKKYIHQYFKKIFEIDGKFYKYKNRNAYEYYVGSKVLFIFLNKVCELPEGNKKGKLHVPQMVLDSDAKIKAHFLAGFFDADGYITINKKIGFGLNSEERKLLEELKSLFEDLDINTRAITRLGGRVLKGWEFSISWDSLSIFIDKIPSKHPCKSKKLKELKQTLL